MGRIACIGTGNVGRAWAVVFARAGNEVVLHDREHDRASGALPLIRRTLEQLAEVHWLSEPVSSVMARIHPCEGLAEAVSDTVHVQESVAEDLEAKRAVFEEMGRHAPIDATLASSTSALRGSEFLGGIRAPERALVAHPVNPPSLIPLVELCGSRWTSPETLARVREFMSGLGMRPVTLRKEIDGFLLNRLQYTLVAEALHLVGEGYCSAEDIDAVVTQGLALRWISIGPFMTAHLNATEGFQSFVDQLGPMMRRMGEDARTDYPWTADLAAAVHESMTARVPVEAIPERQAWRDGRILAARMFQREDPANEVLSDAALSGSPTMPGRDVQV